MMRTSNSSAFTHLFNLARISTLAIGLCCILNACSSAPKSVANTSCPSIPPEDNQLQRCGAVPAICEFGGEPGYYRVKLEFKDKKENLPLIYAESRRLMFDPTIAGSDAQCLELTVNVREREGQALQESASDGVPGLNLRIPKGVDSIRAMSVQQIAAPRVLFIAGDSTVCDQDPQWQRPSNERFSGWGQILPAYFSSAISVANYADSGEGSEAFRTDGGALWQMMAQQIKAGDWMLIQLGHNDKKTPAALYRSRMENLLNAIKARGAQPILISPMLRNNGAALDQQHIYGDLVVRNELQALAAKLDVPYIDLMALSHGWAQRLGKQTAQSYFVKKDQTHSNQIGAGVFAQMIVDELKKTNSGLAQYLRD